MTKLDICRGWRQRPCQYCLFSLIRGSSYTSPPWWNGVDVELEEVEEMKDAMRRRATCQLKHEKPSDDLTIELTASERAGPLADEPHEVWQSEREDCGDRSGQNARNGGDEGLPQSARVDERLEPRDILDCLRGVQ